MKQLLTIRWVFFYIFFLTIGCFAAAAYIQFELGLLPCPLCQLQRFALGFIGFFALLATIHGPRIKGVQFYSILIMLFSILGGLLAARQIELQSQSTSITASNCGVSLDYIIQTLPFLDAIKFIIEGSSNCAEITWRFLGFSITEWTLGVFTLFFLISLCQLFRAKR